MASIEKRKTKKGTHYRALIRKRGFPSESATFRRLTDAKEWAKKRESAMDEGRHFPERQARKRTLLDLVARYTNRVVREGGGLGGNRAFLKLSRGEQSKRIMQLDWWVDRLGNPTLAQMTPALLADWRDRLAEGAGPTKRPVSEATVNRYLAALSCAFTYATRELGWVASNPVRDVNRHREPQGRVRFLNEGERERLLDACRNSSDQRLYPLVVLALSTGARQGELLGLCWRDVDLKRGKAVLHHTKNRERRALPIAGLAGTTLADMEERAQAERRSRKVESISAQKLEDEPVFVGPRGEVSFPRQAWEDALRAAEIKDFRFHDLRHSAASYLAMNGATLAEIAEVLGHKTLAMVKRYSHLTEQHTSAVVTRMNEAIFGE